MNIDTNNLVSITEANQNFSKIARMVDEKYENVKFSILINDIISPSIWINFNIIIA